MAQRPLAVLAGAGWRAEITSDDAIEVNDAAAIERPDDVATRLVAAGHAPTMLHVEEEDLEHYFLRLIGPGCRRRRMNASRKRFGLRSLKARRSRMPLFTALGICAASSGLRFLHDRPEGSGTGAPGGLISAKARIVAGSARLAVLP